MVVFQLQIKIGTLEKKLGKEPVTMDISEMEMASLLKSLARWNKTLYIRIAKELIEEGHKEGYEMYVESRKIEITCPSCKQRVKI
jgi:hypothetical protein